MLRLRMRDRLTQEEIGEREGMSQPVVSRVLAEALGVLRDRMSADPAMVEEFEGDGKQSMEELKNNFALR